MPIKEKIGQRKKMPPLLITEDMIASFEEVVGARHRAQVPPTFVTLFRDTEFGLIADLEYELRDVIHGEQNYSFHWPLKANDTVSCETVLKDAMEKKGAHPTVFLVLETTLSDAHSDRIFSVAKTILIVKPHSA